MTEPRVKSIWLPPIIGKKYLWNHGGTNRIPYTVTHIKEKYEPEITHSDGSISPGRTVLWVSDGGTGYVQWISKDFEEQNG